MIGYIKGKTLHANDGVVILENNGFGFEVVCSAQAYEQLVNVGYGGVYTYLAVREDALNLYGFISLEEKSMFLKLITVSGVGPKVALSVLSLLTPEKFALAVCSEDQKAISKASGVGAKTAARIILELRDKLMKSSLAPSASSDTRP